MQGVEPSACLVYTFGNEVGWEKTTALDAFLVLEGIVLLSVWHGSGVEPDVNEVEFAVHGFSGRAHKHDVVDIGTMEVDLVVVFGCINARLEAFVA